MDNASATKIQAAYRAHRVRAAIRTARDEFDAICLEIDGRLPNDFADSKLEHAPADSSASASAASAKAEEDHAELMRLEAAVRARVQLLRTQRPSAQNAANLQQPHPQQRPVTLQRRGANT